MIKTQAAVLVELNKPLELCTLEIPPLMPGQVLVKMAYSGFCHSQLNEIRGLKGPDRFLPHTLGHEGTGIVLEVGANVTKVMPGDHVVATWIKGKGCDVTGCQYISSSGKVNSGAISTFLTHAIIAENRLVAIPKEVDLREAALFGCALPTGAGVIHHEMQIKPGQSLAIFGVGGIGMSALVAAKIAQANPIIAIDIHASKLKRAEECGATHTIHAGSNATLEAIYAITQGKGVDFALEAAGKREAMEQAFGSLKAPYGLCVLAGNLPQGEKITIDPFDLIRGKSLKGTWGGSSQVDNDIALFASLHQQKKLPISNLITHEVPLSKINHLIEKFDIGEVGRGLIAFS